MIHLKCTGCRATMKLARFLSSNRKVTPCFHCSVCHDVKHSPSVTVTALQEIEQFLMSLPEVNIKDERRAREKFVKGSKQAYRASYHAYLETPEWAALRNKALELAGHRCQLCNASNDLRVHHRTYERVGNEKLSDLLVLCEPCHKGFHKSVGGAVRKPSNRGRNQG